MSENKDMRELSLDEMGKVSGGELFESNFSGPCMGPFGLDTIDDYATMLDCIIKQFGVDTAISFANSHIVASKHNEYLKQGVGAWRQFFVSLIKNGG